MRRKTVRGLYKPVRRVDDHETLPLGEPQEDPDDPDDETAVDGRTRAAGICAQHANQPDDTHTFLDAW